MCKKCHMVFKGEWARQRTRLVSLVKELRTRIKDIDAGPPPHCPICDTTMVLWPKDDVLMWRCPTTWWDESLPKEERKIMRCKGEMLR